MPKRAAGARSISPRASLPRRTLCAFDVGISSSWGFQASTIGPGVPWYRMWHIILVLTLVGASADFGGAGCEVSFTL